MTWWILFSETGQVLVFINRHNPTMNLVEEKQKGLIPQGLQSWPLQLIEHLINTASVTPPPAGSGGCHPMYLLHLLNLSFTIWVPNRCCILQFRLYQSFVCNLLSTPRWESQVPAKETESASCFRQNIRDMLTPIHVLCDCDIKIFCRLKVSDAECSHE